MRNARAAARERQRMGEHRRDADAAGEQQVLLPAEAELEMIGGPDTASRAPGSSVHM